MLSLNESVLNIVNFEVLNHQRRTLHTQLHYYVHGIAYNTVLKDLHSNIKKTTVPTVSAIRFFMEGRIIKINFND